MSNVENDALEDLLRHAGRRPTPAADDLAAAKAALRNEWRDVIGRRKTGRRLVNFGIAAVLLIGFFASVNLLRTPAMRIEQVATIEKSIGPVFLLGERAVLRPTGDLTNVSSGQTIVTGEGAALAIAWGAGGSLRVDENTRVLFTDSETILVEDGRIYFDSRPVQTAVLSAGDASALVVQTKHGDVRHLGTQYMADVERDKLIVSVREGRVSVDGVYYDETIVAGRQATFVGHQRPTVLSIGRTGQDWDWIARTTPAADVDGKSLHEFLVWASRELGLELQFEGQAEKVAHEAILRGTIDTNPADALRLRLATAALGWRIEGDIIYITD